MEETAKHNQSSRQYERNNNPKSRPFVYVLGRTVLLRWLLLLQEYRPRYQLDTTQE
jgi:hypothetical protein